MILIILTALIVSIIVIAIARRKRKIPQIIGPSIIEPVVPVVAQVESKCGFCNHKILKGSSMSICTGCGKSYHHNCANSVKLCPNCGREIRSETSIIDEVFLMYKDGRLIRHETRRLKPDMDQDILASMLVAVQEFIKDSFRGEKGALEEMKFGEFKLIVGRGNSVIIVASIIGEEVELFKIQMERVLADIELGYGPMLREWDGDRSKVESLSDFVRDLIKGKYRDTNYHRTPILTTQVYQQGLQQPKEYNALKTCSQCGRANDVQSNVCYGCGIKFSY